MADLEALILSGGLFNGENSPDNGWPEDRRKDSDDESEDSNTGSKPGHSDQHEPPMTSIGMGPGRTGVKGVIRDRDEATSIERAQRAKAVEELNRQMEKASLGGKTFLEEEREKKKMLEGDDVVKELLRPEKRNAGGKWRERFGHLREVGVEGFVSAVEAERGVWVVVHLYEPSLERCAKVDATMAYLARMHPETKFLRARASSLGFTSTGERSRPMAPASRKSIVRNVPGHYFEDDDDPYGGGDDDDGGEDDDEDEDEEEGDKRKVNANVDMEMLPTLLVYRDGNLVHNWVRVDWEAGRAGLEELLSKHHILRESIFDMEDDSPLDDDALDDDDGDDEQLPWSD